MYFWDIIIRNILDYCDELRQYIADCTDDRLDFKFWIFFSFCCFEYIDESEFVVAIKIL